MNVADALGQSYSHRFNTQRLGRELDLLTLPDGRVPQLWYNVVVAGNAEEPIRFVVRPFGIHNFDASIFDFEPERLRDAPPSRAVAIDLTGVTFVRPSMLVLLRAFAELNHKGDAARGIPARRVFVRYPVSKAVRTYMNVMNLFKGARKPAQLSLDLEGEIHHHQPLQALTTTDEVEDVADGIRRIVLDALPRNQGQRTKIGTSLGVLLAELLENFRKHSESTGRRGFVCAQYYAPGIYDDAGPKNRIRGGVIEIAVADTGIGIRRSLSVVPQLSRRIAAGANPCELATEFGITSKPGVHGGYGLWVAKRTCVINGGCLKIASETDRFVAGLGRKTKAVQRVSWPGTFVALRLGLSGSLDVTRVYDELPPLPLLTEG
jgi:hypothetical protein